MQYQTKMNYMQFIKVFYLVANWITDADLLFRCKRRIFQLIVPATRGFHNFLTTVIFSSFNCRVIVILGLEVLLWVDKCFAILYGMLPFPQHKLFKLDRSLFDHHPIIYGKECKDWGRKPFYFWIISWWINPSILIWNQCGHLFVMIQITFV